MSDGDAAELARFIAGTDIGNVPDSVVQRAQLIIADTLAAAIRGSLEREMRRLLESLGRADGACFPWCAPSILLSPREAALFNATAACFLELDEGCPPTGHPAIHVLPTVLADAQNRHASGAKVLSALIVGYETQARLQRACTLRDQVHPHGTFGLIGAVAGLANLRAWPATEAEQALNIAAALTTASPWQPCYSGATVRNVYAGHAAQTAFTVADLAESGFSGDDHALSEQFGRIVADGFDMARLQDRLGEKYALVESYFKFHAACGYLHPVIEALADACGLERATGVYPLWNQKPPFQPKDVESIQMRVSQGALRLRNLPARTALSAKFSLPFGAATFLVAGRSDPAAFDGSAVVDDETWRLMSVINVEEDRNLSFQSNPQDCAEITIRLRNGTTLQGSCYAPYGTAAHPASVVDLEAKFHALTADCLDLEGQAGLWKQLMSLEQLGDVANLFPHGSS